MAKLLLCSKDMGGAKIGTPLVESARKRSHLVRTVVEGLAAEFYENLAARLQDTTLRPIFKGTVDYKAVPFTLDAVKLIEVERPSVDAVVVTMGSPINLEQTLGDAATATAKPLVAVSDFWGSLARLKEPARAGLMLAIDEVDAEAARNYFKHDFKVVVVGNHAVASARQMIVPTYLVEEFRGLKARFGTVILLAGGGPDYTTSEIKLLAACLGKTPGPWGLVKRYHGKHANAEALDGRTWREVWDEMLAPIADRTVEVEVKRPEEADALAILADVTVSGFSTMMTPAVVRKRGAIALVTPEVHASLARQTQNTIRRYPLATMGLVPEVEEPCDLTPHLEWRPDPEEADRRLQPYQPEVALDAIEKLVG